MTSLQRLAFFQVTLGENISTKNTTVPPKFDSRKPWKVTFQPKRERSSGLPFASWISGGELRRGPFTVSWPGPLFAIWRVLLVGDPLLAGTRRQSAGLPAFLVVGCDGWMSHSHESGRSSSCWGWRWGPVAPGGKGQPSQSHRIHVCMVYFP